MSNNSSLSKRAALRQQQELDERTQRTKRILIWGSVLAAITVVAVIAIVIVQAIGVAARTSGDQQRPPNATAEGGILLEGKQPSADKPHLIVWEDYQCPACAAREQSYGPLMETLVAQDKITVEIRTAHFLDGKSSDGPSKRAAIAAAAADAVGRFREYHKTVYANQPREGIGYSDQTLTDQFTSMAGITGDQLSEFKRLYSSRAFADFVDSSNSLFDRDKVGSTPTYVVSGKRLNFFDKKTETVLIQPTEADFLRAVTEAWEAGSKQVQASPEPTVPS